jgi:hypothetical protein
MLKSGILMVIVLLLFKIFIIAQDNEPKNKGRIDISLLIIPIDTIDNFVIYKKKTVKYIVEGKVFNEKKFYIKVPIGMNFHSYAKRGKTVYYAFSNMDKIIVVAIHRKKLEIKNKPPIKYLDDIEDIHLVNLIKSIVDVAPGKFIGYFNKGKYIIYYCNVKEDEMPNYNEAIKSISRRR